MRYKLTYVKVFMDIEKYRRLEIMFKFLEGLYGSK